MNDKLKLIVLCLLFLALMLLTSCRTTRTAEREYITQHDTAYIDRMQRDSIYLRDSIYHEVVAKGDTIYSTKYIERTKFRDRFIHDSVYIHKTDTVLVDVVKEVERKPTFAQRTKNWLGSVFIFFMILFAIYIIARILLKKIKG